MSNNYSSNECQLSCITMHEYHSRNYETHETHTHTNAITNNAHPNPLMLCGIYQYHTIYVVQPVSSLYDTVSFSSIIYYYLLLSRMPTSSTYNKLPVLLIVVYISLEALEVYKKY